MSSAPAVAFTTFITLGSTVANTITYVNTQLQDSPGARTKQRMDPFAIGCIYPHRVSELNCNGGLVVAGFFASSGIYVLAFVAAVAVADMGTQRIPNLLTVSAASLGVMLNFRSAGGHGVLMSAAGLLTGLAVFLPFYFAKGFGAGDVKAMGAVGAFVGPHGVMLAAAWTLIAGAICALMVLIVRRELSALASLPRRWVWHLFSAYATGQPAPLVVSSDDPTRRRFPYGLAVACGTAFSLLWSTP